MKTLPKLISRGKTSATHLSLQNPDIFKTTRRINNEIKEAFNSDQKIPRINITNVAKLFYSDNGIYDSDITNIKAPFERFWMEFEFWNWVFVDPSDKNNYELKDDMEYAGATLGLYCQEVQHENADEFTLVMALYYHLDGENKIHGPIATINMPYNKDGVPEDTSIKLYCKTMDEHYFDEDMKLYKNQQKMIEEGYEIPKPYPIPEFEENGGGSELVKDFHTSIDMHWPTSIAVGALQLMNCKNIKIVDPKTCTQGKKPKSLTDKVLEKISINELRRKEHVIVIDHKATYSNSKGVSTNGDDFRAAHLCRGHFRTYTDDAPLFGKITGTFWIPSHVRGKGNLTGEFMYEVK